MDTTTQLVAPRRVDRPWLALTAAVAGGVMVSLDGTATTIAAPYIARSAQATLPELQWIANAYLVTLALGLLPAGRIADRFGRRATFVAGALAFGATSVAIALSDSVPALVCFRAVQGLAGALLQPAALALLHTAFDERRMPVALGVWGGLNALAIGVGPVIAGAIVGQFGWPAVFVVNLPIGVLAALLAKAATAESYGPGSRVLGSIRELFAARTVAVSAAILALSSFGIFALLFALTLYLQNVHGLSPVEAGLWLLPPTAVVMVSAPLGGVLGDRFGTRWPMAGGMVLVAAGLFGVAGLDPDAGFARLVVPALAVGAGTGLCVVPATNALLGAARETLTGMASAVQQAASQVGGVVGISVTGSVLAGQVAAVLPRLLRAQAVPASVASGVTAAADGVAQGRVPAGGPASAAVRAAAHTAFTSGMSVALLVSAAVAVAGAALAALFGTRR